MTRPRLSASLLGLALAALAPAASSQALFRDASATHLPPPLGVSQSSMDVEAVDLDGDGDLDLVIASEFQTNVLLVNDGAGHFSDGSAGLGTLPTSEVPGPAPPAHDTEDVAAEDFDGDGHVDLVFVSEDDVRHGRSDVHEYYRGRGDGTAGTARSLVDGAGGADGDVREALGTIERRSRGLVAFVDAYRTLARLPRPRPRVVPASELLGDVATLARVTAPGVTVVVEVDPPGLEVVADADLVEQALVNLALNAVEALGERDGGRVILRAYPGPSGRAVVEVEDDGPGLLPEIRERAFVPFFSTKPGGSGVGLALAHRIARLHGGALTVESEPDVRTVFTLRL